MSARAYWFGIDQSRETGLTSLAIFWLRPDGVREMVAFTMEPEEVASLLADTDFRTDGPK